MIEDYLFDLRLSGAAESTIREYGRRLRRLPFLLPGTTSEVRAWLAGRPSTTDAIYELRVIRAFARWHQVEFGSDLSDLLAIRSPKAPGLRPGRIAREDEITRVIAYLEAHRLWRDLALVELFRWTGCRRSEAARLLLEDVDLVGMQLRFRGTKNGDDRVVPLHPVLARAIRRYVRQRLFQGPLELFLGRYGQPLSPNAVGRTLRKAFRAAGVPQLSTHQFRRRLAHVWVENGGQDDALALVGGWRSMDMIYRYRREFTAERAADTYRRIFDAPRAGRRGGVSPGQRK